MPVLSTNASPVQRRSRPAIESVDGRARHVAATATECDAARRWLRVRCRHRARNGQAPRGAVRRPVIWPVRPMPRPRWRRCQRQSTRCLADGPHSAGCGGAGAQSPSVRTGFGAGRWLLAGAAFVVCAGGTGPGAVACVRAEQIWGSRGTSPDPTATPTTQPASTSASPIALPGTDAQGFIDYPGARCDAGSSPAALARTTHSVLVVCRAGPGDFYYRGVRLSDGAGIELANAVRSSGGSTSPIRRTAPAIRYGRTP